MAEDPRVADFLARNKEYAKAKHTPIFTLESVKDNPDPPALIIISCFDKRINPRQFFQFTEPGEAFVLANAGGRVDNDTLRTLIVLDNVIGIKTVMIVHHTDCGLTHVTDEKIRTQLKERNPENAGEVEELKGWFGEIEDMDQSVRDDVAAVQASPFLKHVDVRGFVFNIGHGGVGEVK